MPNLVTEDLQPTNISRFYFELSDY